MKPWILLLLYIFFLHPFSINGQLPLTQMVFSAESILQARYVDAVGDSLIFLSKDVFADDGFNDTIILLQSETFPPLGLDKELRIATNNRIISALEQSKELLLFVHHMDGNVVHIYYSGIRIWIDDEVRFTDGPIVYDDAHFVSFPERISWNEMLHRLLSIEARFKPVYALNEIKNPAKRNKALFQWLDEHIHEFDLACDFNADCGWGGFQDVVLRWIITANDMEDTWKVGEVFQQIYPKEKRSFDDFDGVYRRTGEAFTSAKGISFLLGKAMDPTRPVIERKQAFIFLLHSTDFILLDTFQMDSYFQKRSQAERQQDLLDQLMPLMYDTNVAFLAFLNIRKLSHSEAPIFESRKNLSKLEELIEIYKTQPPTIAKIRDRLTSFLLTNCTVDQWKSITGNDTLMHVSLHNIFYNEAMQQLRFGIYYQAPKGFILEKPKVRFEKWSDGMISDTVVKEFYNQDGSPYKPDPTYIQQLVDVSDLDPGEWTYRLFGVAGDHGQFKWQSERSTFRR